MGNEATAHSRAVFEYSFVLFADLLFPLRLWIAGNELYSCPASADNLVRALLTEISCRLWPVAELSPWPISTTDPDRPWASVPTDCVTLGITGEY